MLDRHEVLAEETYFALAEAHAQREALSAFRERLRRLGYTEEAVTRSLGVEGPYALTSLGREIWPRYAIPGNEPVPVLIRLFLLALAEPRTLVRDLLGGDIVDVLVGSRLLDQEGSGRYRSPISLYPVGPLYVATDWWREPRDGPEPDSNRVMPLGRDSYALTRLLASCRGRTAVDLCTGSGLGALKAALTFERVLGVDIDPRAVNFARFNAVLNGIHNCAFERGDLYEAVDAGPVDLICANPPFVPGPRAHLRYRDGGPTGEDVLARILGGFAGRLEDDGVGLVVSDLVEHRGVRYEDKVVRWLGADAGMSAVVLRRPAETIDRYVSSHISHTVPFGVSPLLFEWIDHYREAGIEEVARGYIAVRRSRGRETVVATVPVERPVVGDLPEGTLQGLLDRAAAVTSHPITDLTFTPRFIPGRVEVRSPEPALDGGSLPYVVVEQIEASRSEADGFSVSSLVAALEEKGLHVGPSRRRQLEDTVRWLYVSGSLGPVDAADPMEERDRRRAAALELWWSA